MDSSAVIARLAAAALLAAASFLPSVAAAQDTPVDLELVLAVDVSGSMDIDERTLQRQGYVQALTHPDVLAAIGGGIYGRIALSYVEWAGPLAQSVVMPWRIIDGPDAAEAAAAHLAAAPHTRIRGTSISGALLFASGLFEGSGFEGMRRVIDISGDGPNNMGVPVVPVRDEVVAQGVVINGLPLTLKTGSGGIRTAGLLDVYYEDCVIGGPGAFMISVTHTGQLAEAIRRKLVLEIAGLPARVVPAALGTAATQPRIDCLIGERSRPSWLQER
jgi:hypothetical protein